MEIKLALALFLFVLPFVGFSQDFSSYAPSYSLLKKIQDSVANLLYNLSPTASIITVSGTTQQLDTGKVYQMVNPAMCMLNLPNNPTNVKAQLITIVGYGAGGFTIVPQTGQTIVGVNGVGTTGTNGVLMSTSRNCTMTLRYVSTGTWQLTSAQGNFLFNATRTLNALGSAFTTFPATVLNTAATETVLFQDTIYANNLITGKHYNLEGHIYINTPLTSLATLTLKFYFGNGSVSILNTALSIGSLSGAPLIIYADIIGKGNAAQIMTANIVQPQTPIINLSTSNSTLRQNFTQDATIDNIIKVTATLTGTVTSTSVGVDWFSRNPI